MTKDFYFNTAWALDKAKADRDKPVTPVEYIPVDEHVCSYNECGFCEDPNCNVYGDADVEVTMPPMTNEGADANISMALQPKGGGEVKLKEKR